MDTFRASRKYLDTGSEEEGPVESVDPALNPEEIAIKQEALVRLRTAMTRLTPQQRYAVFMRAEGLRYREIAAVLNISTQRVAELVQRALTRLAGDL
jgi:RNA polymerase sigma-70 factor (ECF subfamily)